MFKRKNGIWQEKFQTPEMIKPKYFYSSETSEKRARADINKQIYEFQAVSHHKKHNFFELCEQTLESKNNEIEYNTQEMYHYAFKRIPDTFNINIEDIEPYMVQKLLKQLADRQYSYSAIHQVRTLFGIVYDYAILNGLKIFNFMRSVKMPKSVKKNKVHSPDDEVIEFIKSNAETVEFGLWMLFLLATGARLGEANAIQKKNIDFKDKEIDINKATIFVSNKPVIKEAPKTNNGIRTPPLLDILYEPLKKHCDKLKNDDYIFGGKTPLKKSTIRSNLNKYKKACGYNFTNHQLRHAYAKLLWLAGVDVKTAQGLLGHASIQTTMDWYTDFDKTMNNKAAKKVNRYLKKN